MCSYFMNWRTAVNLSQLEFKELESQNEDLAKDVNTRLKQAQELGAKEGVQRLAFVSKHFQKLSLEEAYHLINPNALQNEIEEAQAGKYWIGFWQVLRNSFGVAPLILTWFALFRAVSDYQADLKRHP